MRHKCKFLKAQGLLVASRACLGGGSRPRATVAAGTVASGVNGMLPSSKLRNREK